MTMQSILKDLDGFNGDYNDTAAQKPQSDCYDQKRTPEIVGEIQARIDDDPSKSIRSIAITIGVSDQASSA